MRAPTFIGVVIGFALLSLVFGGVELAVRKRWIGGRSADFPTRRRDFTTYVNDVVYWAFTPLVTGRIVGLFVGAVLVLMAVKFGRGEAGVKAMLAYIQDRSPISKLPAVVQGLLGFALADLIQYWTHRWFHHIRWMWPFHAVHHSSETLDWLAASRVHPVNELVSKLALTVPLVLLGFKPAIFASVAPVLTFYAIFIHADVPWSFRPLRYVITSPRFHRWHHTSAEEGLDKNFAGLFPFWDLLFGTFYMPAHEPTVFGVTDDVPAGIYRQLLWPFRRRSAAIAPAPIPRA